MDLKLGCEPIQETVHITGQYVGWISDLVLVAGWIPDPQTGWGVDLANLLDFGVGFFIESVA